MYQRLEELQNTEGVDRGEDRSLEEQVDRPSEYTETAVQHEDGGGSRSFLSDVFEPLDNFDLPDDFHQLKEKAEVEDEHLDAQRLEATSWMPGFLAHLPWLGFLAIVSNASIVVLIVSNNPPIDHWSTNGPPICNPQSGYQQQQRLAACLLAFR
jgi:hypothetical protein